MHNAGWFCRLFDFFLRNVSSLGQEEEVWKMGWEVAIAVKKLNDWLWHPQVPTIGQRPKLHYKVPIASLESSIGTISPVVKLHGQQKALWKSKLAKHWPVGMHSLL